MPAQMTPTAWGQGVKNALICGFGVLAAWFTITAFFAVNFQLPLLHSIGVAFAALCGLVLVVFLGTWIYGRNAAGRVLLDCGTHPTKILFLINAAIFPILGVVVGLNTTSLSWTFGIAGPVLGVSFGVFYLIMATGRLQVRENGIWAYWGLLPWGKVGSYQWANDGTLLVRRKGPLALMQGALPVPPEHKQAVEELLAKHVPAQANA